MKSPVFTNRVFNSGVFTPMARGPRGVESEYCLGFDGVNDFVSVSGSDILAPTSSPWSVSLWFYVDPVPADYGRLVTLKSNSSPCHIFWSTHPQYDFCIGGDGWGKVWRTAKPTTGRWHHLVVSYNGSGVTTAANFLVTVDGLPQTLNSTSGVGAVSNTTVIGSFAGAGGGEFLKGRIDDVRIYSRALTADEVSAIYNNVTAPPTSGLVAHFPFEEGTGTTTTDSVGGLVGTLTNGPTWQPQVPPRLIRNRETEDWSLSFDGTDDFITVPHNAALSLTSSFTITMWVKISSSSLDGNDVLLSKFDSNYNYLIYFSSASKPRIYSSGLTPSQLDSPEALATGVWTNVVFTYSSGSRGLYLNGILVVSDSPTGTPLTNSGNITFGSDSGGSFPCPCQLKDVRIYNTALPLASITKLARGVDPTETPVAQWRLNEGTGTTANDSVGSNHGTLTNGPTWSGDIPLWFREARISTNSLQLDGIDDYVTVSDSVSLSITADISIMGWFKRTANGAKYLIDKGSTSYRVYFNSSNNLVFDKSGGAVIAQSSTAYTDTNWHSFCVTSGSKVYVDGVDVTASGISQAFADTTAALEIGRLNGGGSPFSGYLDDLRIKNRVASSAEAADHAAGYNVTAGDVSLWPMDGNANDILGPNNGSTQSGATFSTEVPGSL